MLRGLLLTVFLFYLNNSHNYKKKNFSEERKNYEQNLLKILKEKQGNRNLVKNILDLNEKFFGDIEQLDYKCKYSKN